MAAHHLHVALLLCMVFHQADSRSGTLSNSTLRSKRIAQAERGYTQNSLCRQNNCINPIFPGLNDLPRLEALTWQCSSTAMTKNYMGFCKDAVLYDPALPSPVSEAKSVTELIKAQDDAAMTMFVYHLSGMGYDAWDFREPSQSDNDCVRAVWKMVCYTYFPRANAGCKAGERSLYERPCGSSCKNYLSHCNVECCDESVQCSFTHTKTNKEGKVEVLQTGYVDANGPSATCTGGARRSVATPFFLLLAILGFHCLAGASNEIVGSGPVAAHPARGRSVLRLSKNIPLLVIFAGLGLGLQGCSSQISRHEVGNWRAKPDYLSEFKFLPPGANPRNAILNSCAVKDVAPSLQCSGRGYCSTFTTNSLVAQERDQGLLSFCKCDPGWADPECGTPRKSQMKAFAFSVCLGMFGADYFYLGYPLWGMGKLFTVGGLGFWWLVDIVRIASGPVYAQKFRTANDLPHWVAILILVFLCMVLGFLAAIESYLGYRKKRRDDIAWLQNNEEASHFKDTQKNLMSGYGTAMPNTGAPFAGTGGGGLLYSAGTQGGWASPMPSQMMPTPMTQFAGRQ